MQDTTSQHRVLLAGAQGGIGGALLEQLRQRDDIGHLTATTRKPGASSAAACNLTWLPLDFRRPDDLDGLAAHLAATTDRLDTIICTTGYLHGEYGGPEKSLGHLTPASLSHAYAVNAAGPLQLLTVCEPYLKRAEAPRVLVLSAQVGSIGDNQLGGWYSYRMAKAALNMGLKTAAIEAARWRNDATVVAVHPGTTVSPLSTPFIARRKAPVASAEETASRLLELWEQLTPADNGTFLTSRGEALPW